MSGACLFTDPFILSWRASAGQPLNGAIEHMILSHHHSSPRRRLFFRQT
jgi:hypothetical protein